MSTLYLIPTPVGNLGDITYRAVELLRDANAILCEDTRTSGKLLKHLEISKPLIAYHQHNEHKLTPQIVARIQGGEKICLITDAGTPGISDPGFLLVRACIEAGVDVNCLPGATAFVPALVQSGFPTNQFVFEGFLPQKKGRKTRLEALAQETRTIIVYESPFRIVKLLEEIKEHFPAGTRVSISREISKMFEETIRGSAEELLTHFKNKPPKGEFVVVIKAND